MNMFLKNPASNWLSLFYRQMAVMSAAGVTVHEAITLLSEENENSQIKSLTGSIKNEIDKGNPVEQSMAKYPHVFPEMLIKILETEEPGEKVAKILNSLADEAEITWQLKSRLFHALFLPINTIFIAFMIVIIIMIYVIPVFQEMFADFGQALPSQTRMVISISAFIKNYLIVIILLIGAIPAVMVMNKKIRYGVVSLMPGFNHLLKKISVFNFIRNLSMMLSFNLPVRESVIYAASAVKNVLYAEKLESMGETVTDLKQLREAMQSTGIFPKLVLQMTAVGERSDSTEYVLQETSKFYEKEIDTYMFRLLGIIDILTIAFLGIVIGYLVIAMYLPIFKMAGAIVG